MGGDDVFTAGMRAGMRETLERIKAAAEQGVRMGGPEPGGGRTAPGAGAVSPAPRPVRPGPA